jgi:NAD(P)H dehydrogenase (quinone)
VATPKVAVIYYSATGTVHRLAQEYAAGAEDAGAEVRVRSVTELVPAEAIAANPTWQAHSEAVNGQPVATAEDVLWADAVVFGSPTRFGNMTAQLKQFIDTLGPQWAQGQLADKVYSGFTSTSTNHGGHESTLLALYNAEAVRVTANGAQVEIACRGNEWRCELPARRPVSPYGHDAPPL